MIDRGERIELLVDRTENLTATSANFKKKSTDLKNLMWWKNIKLWIVIGFVLLVDVLHFNSHKVIGCDIYYLGCCL